MVSVIIKVQVIEIREDIDEIIRYFKYLFDRRILRTVLIEKYCSLPICVFDLL